MLQSSLYGECHTIYWQSWKIIWWICSCLLPKDSDRTNSWHKEKCNTWQWLTSTPLAVSLHTDHKLTIVSTHRKYKKEIPKSIITLRRKQVHSCQHAFHGPQSLVSYISQKNKIALLLSAVHRTAPIVQDTMKSEIIQFYNKTKGMWTHWTSTATHSVSRETRCWLMSMFCAMLDECGINTLIYFINANTMWKNNIQGMVSWRI